MRKELLLAAELMISLASWASTCSLCGQKAIWRRHKYKPLQPKQLQIIQIHQACSEILQIWLGAVRIYQMRIGIFKGMQKEDVAKLPILWT